MKQGTVQGPGAGDGWNTARCGWSSRTRTPLDGMRTERDVVVHEQLRAGLDVALGNQGGHEHGRQGRLERELDDGQVVEG